MSKLLIPADLHDYQREAIQHGLTHCDVMYWLQMGLGKSIVALTVTNARMQTKQVRKTLVFGPLRVIQSVWHVEARKWSHTKHLRFSILHGNREKRTRALFADADIYLCNYENMNWLAETLDHYYTSQDKPLPFDCVIYDEVTQVKNSTSKRIKGGKRDRVDERGDAHEIKVTGWRKFIDCFKYRMGLTGSPASNGYLDLFGQFLVVDGGQRLGPYVTHYKDSYFSSDYNGWKYTVTETGKAIIESKIKDIVIKMDAADHLEMPALTTTNIMVDLPPKVRIAYEKMELNMFAELDSGTELEVFSRASVSNKCLQMCSGSAYLSNESSEYEILHDIKLKALAEIIDNANGQPVLCGYTFRSDAERIMKKFKKLAPVNLTAEPSNRTENIIKRWQAGDIKLMIGHPKSMGHGIDGLQHGGSLAVWFGVCWSLELYEQLVWRLFRQGQKHPVTVVRILCNDTVDLAVVDAIERKVDNQNGLKAALSRYRNGHTTNELEVNFF